MIIPAGDQQALEDMAKKVKAANILGFVVQTEHRAIGQQLFQVVEILNDDGTVRISFEIVENGDELITKIDSNILILQTKKQEILDARAAVGLSS